MSCLFNMRDRNPGRRSGLDNKHLICARLGGGGVLGENAREREREREFSGPQDPPQENPRRRSLERPFSQRLMGGCDESSSRL